MATPTTLAELASAYALAGSQREVRRDLVFRAIDAGYIGVGKPLENVKLLCSGDGYFAIEEERYAEDGKGCDRVEFVMPTPGAPFDHTAAGQVPGAWGMNVFHTDGVVVHYSITNTRIGSPEPKPDPLTAEEMADCYRRAAEGIVKRDICVRAIDAGYIAASRTHIEDVRRLFGDDFQEAAGQLGSRTVGVVRFSQEALLGDGGCGYRGAALVLLYNKQGRIEDYGLQDIERVAQIQGAGVRDGRAGP